MFLTLQCHYTVYYILYKLMPRVQTTTDPPDLSFYISFFANILQLIVLSSNGQYLVLDWEKPL